MSIWILNLCLYSTATEDPRQLNFACNTNYICVLDTIASKIEGIQIDLNTPKLDRKATQNLFINFERNFLVHQWIMPREEQYHTLQDLY